MDMHQQRMLILSFDYELYFGDKSGTPENCLYKPTEALISMLDEHGCKAIFFIDILCYWKMRKEGLVEEAERFRKHVQSLLARGHDVQLHIHPHWLDARYHINGWQFTHSRYRLHDLGNFNDVTDMHTVIGCIFNCKRILEEIGQETEPLYRVYAFRAGGWCLQPFSALTEGFSRSGLLVDSSVVPGWYSQKNARQDFNFKNAPNKPSWRFESDVLTERHDGRFIEVPIAAAAMSNWRRVVYSVIKKLKGGNWTPYGDGVSLSVGSTSNEFLRKLVMILTPFSKSVKFLSCGYAIAEEMKWTAETFAKKVVIANEPIVFIGHPKELSEASINNLSKFLKTGAYRTTTYKEIMTINANGGLK